MSQQTQAPNAFWSYVTVFGTLWGALELSLGTFLHSLHMPKTGLIMVSLSTTLMLACRFLYPKRGSLLAAGLIAASIKSLSPGGIILGPMLGILSEALILELCMLVRTNLFCAILSASLAILWSQVQSIFKLWLYYGKDFLDAFLRVIGKFFQIQSTSTAAWILALSFLGLIALLGCIAGSLGWHWGRQTQRALDEGWQTKLDPYAANDAPAQSPSPLLPSSAKRRQTACEQSLKTRRLVLPFALLSLCLQFSGELLHSTLALALLLGTLALAARPVLRSLWWPKFWTLTLVVSVLSGLILAWRLEGYFDLALGLEATARMLCRSLYVFALLAWATRSLRAEEILGAWSKIGLPKLGQALQSAYSILPNWLDRFNLLLRRRPQGWKAQWPYLKHCALLCLVQALRDAQESSPKASEK